MDGGDLIKVTLIIVGVVLLPVILAMLLYVAVTGFLSLVYCWGCFLHINRLRDWADNKMETFQDRINQ